MADVEVLKVCPFDGGNAELRVEARRSGYGDYESSTYYHYAECMQCGAKGKEFRQNSLADFTKYTVADFRNNPILRAKVEDEYNEYKTVLRLNAIEAWNKRINADG